MRLTWSARRQILYYGVGFIVAAIIVWWGYNTFFVKAASCFDGIQNQNERGVDCGGTCSLVCAADTKPLTVLWARPFLTAPNIYTATAYVTNTNVTAGAKAVRYSFQLFDDNNSLVIERDGVINIPPVKIIPIVETGIYVGNRTPTRALFAFADTPVWYTAQVPALRVTNEELASDGSHLTATVMNDTLQDIHKVVVAAVLFDAQGVAVGASKSTIDVPKKGSQLVTFTWPQGVPTVVRAELTLLPPF
ncbi:MAG TPA: hypothetical protein VIY48_03645 [Candidatus Paceibacterota bacterium]